MSGGQSKIEWTERTWNPTVGCTKISQGCKNCYAEGMAMRLQAMGTPPLVSVMLSHASAYLTWSIG
ncbi:DUF5131 family protein [Cupriavidus basilensis]